MLPKGAVRLLLLALSLATVTAQTHDGGLSRFHVKKDRPQIISNRRTFDIPAPSARHESGFDPDVLNRFLEEYANKMKRSTTERNTFDDDSKLDHEGQDLEIGPGESNEKNKTDAFSETSTLNDTIKRHKFYSANSHEDRNSGWVTLDAIPWSKSKISKWQANPTTQGPNSWPDSKPWDKPSYNKPSYNSEFPRPSNYENNKPWQNKKPHWSDNSPAASSKPWYSDRPRPQQDRPSYPAIDKYEENPNQAQKWPPERPSWDRYGDSSRPSDIITDNGPPNFPSSAWDRPGQRPSYTHHTESYVSEHGGWHDRNDFPTNNKFGRPNDDGYYDRPHFSHYKYPASSQEQHPSNHPSSGDGQWVLLSTNRGYSKSRQRSIKLDALIASGASNGSNKENSGGDIRKKTSTDNEEDVPAVTSKRQVRLTVLPSINGTNTTTSHGGLLEVERTFKTVDQSQKEYEMEKTSASASSRNQTAKPSLLRPLSGAVLLNRRPIRNTLTGGAPSSSAVLAAVGAGMLPATMAMMIPMMLGKKRRRRSVNSQDKRLRVKYLRLPKEVFEVQRRRM